MGDPLTGHEKVRMVSLTGSIATGEHIIGHTASSIKRTHMELGGKAPVIVLMMLTRCGCRRGADVWFLQCRTGLYGGVPDLCPEGHLCRAGGKAGRSGRQPQNGAPEDDSTELGPLSSAAHLSRVCQAVDEAKALGHIRVVTGGTKKRGQATTSSQPCWRGRSRTTPSFSGRCLARW